MRPGKKIPVRTYTPIYTTAGAVNAVSPANVIPTATTRSPPNHLGPDAIKKYELVASRTFDPGSKEEHHYRIAESQFLRLQSQGHGYQQYKLKQVTWVVNPTLHRRFLLKQNEFKAKYQNKDEYMPILAFHGTPKPENIEMIIRNNFDNSKIRRTSSGHGHYFSEFPDVSVGYSSGTKMLLLCQLLPGRTNDNGGNIPAGYDSNRVGSDGSGRGQMIIIPNVDQILPCYILHFE